ncbi:MAG: DsbA family protein [Alphaproteobacteria bacterium]|nr:DsbA family protein [Alphaproteobacteria bacterium]
MGLGLGLGGAPARAQEAGDRVLGKADAPITIIEYASLTCPHCADFNKEIMPELKQRYVETGKAKIVFRDFPLDQMALRASMLARCAPADKYFAFIDVLFQQQGSWATAKDPMAALEQLGKLGGVPSDKFKTCMADQALADSVLTERLRGANEFKVEGTPTLYVNGKKIDTPRTFADFDKILKPLAPQS